MPSDLCVHTCMSMCTHVHVRSYTVTQTHTHMNEQMNESFLKEEKYFKPVIKVFTARLENKQNKMEQNSSKTGKRKSRHL